MFALSLLQWLLFVALTLLWITFSGTNLVLAMSKLDAADVNEGPQLLPAIGGVCGAAAMLLMPSGLATIEPVLRVLLAGVLFSSDPLWITPPLVHARRALFSRS